MVTLTHPKSPLSSLHIFSTINNKTPSSSSSLTTMKVKTLIHNLIFSHICRVIRAFSKAKSFLLEIFRENQLMHLRESRRKNKYRNKILFGSFRLHYNWCSSSAHVLPVPSPSPSPSPILMDTKTSHIYYDSTWNSVYDGNQDYEVEKAKQDYSSNNNVGKENDHLESELSSYLEWLEENENNFKEGEVKDNYGNEIDKLADLFIASCHEKFRLEKIESYRRYQELLARSL